MVHERFLFWPVIAAVCALSAPAAAQHGTPCHNLVETIESRALKIHDAQNRMSATLDAGAQDRRGAKTCQTARGIIADADELAKFAEARTQRCESAAERDMLRAAISLGSGQIARILAKTFCGE